MSGLLATVNSYLPQHEGLLPKWLLLVSVIAMGNSIQAYSTLKFTRQVYVNHPEASTPLSSRTFGTWSLMNGLIRLYAAYNITNVPLYHITVLSYAVALAHFTMEWLVFGTARLGRGLTGPLVVASGSLVWMFTQWEFYLK